MARAAPSALNGLQPHFSCLINIEKRASTTLVLRSPSRRHIWKTNVFVMFAMNSNTYSQQHSMNQMAVNSIPRVEDSIPYLNEIKGQNAALPSPMYPQIDAAYAVFQPSVPPRSEAQISLGVIQTMQSPLPTHTNMNSDKFVSCYDPSFAPMELPSQLHKSTQSQRTISQNGFTVHHHTSQSNTVQSYTVQSCTGQTQIVFQYQTSKHNAFQIQGKINPYLAVIPHIHLISTVYK